MCEKHIYICNRKKYNPHRKSCQEEYDGTGHPAQKRSVTLMKQIKEIVRVVEKNSIERDRPLSLKRRDNL